jgi:sulfite reductase alpha subunit-like flavoprotein
MENEFKLYMIMLGCRPKGRYTEQHDIFFGIAKSLKDLIPEMKAFWPEAKGQIHIDAWREVTSVENFTIAITKKGSAIKSHSQLFFINLGGYKENEFEEYHYKVLAVGDSLSEATKKSKSTAFYKHFGFKGATSHVDDKFGIDVDDVFNVKEILAPVFTSQFEIQITPSENRTEDQLHIGYLKIDKII